MANIYYLTQRPPSVATYPTHTTVDPQEGQITAYGGRTVYKLTYDTPLTEKDVKRFELLPTVPEGIKEGDTFNMQWAGDTGKLKVVSISEDRTEIQVQELWSDYTGEVDTYNMRGLLKEYSDQFHALVYPPQEEISK